MRADGLGRFSDSDGRAWLKPTFRLPLLFLVCALPLGLVLARLVPVAEVPDETAHIARAYGLSTGQWIGRRRPPFAGTTLPLSGYTIDLGLLAASTPSAEAGGMVSAAADAGRQGAAWSGQTIYGSWPNTATYSPVFYVLSAACLGAGRVMGVSPALSIAAARVANLLGFALMGAVALLLARRARFTLFALLCLPSSVSLAASVSQDGLLIAGSVLGAALLTRPGVASRRWAAVALAAVGMAKPPYLPLVALLVTRRVASGGGGWWRGLGLAAVAALPGVLWSLAVLRWATAPFNALPYAPGPLYGGPIASFASTDSGAQAAILRADPSLLLRLPLHTALAEWQVWATELVGVLGALSLQLPDTLYIVWYLALGCAALGDVLAAPRPGSLPASAAGAGVAVGAALSSAFLVFVVEYLIWTHVGDPIVAGVQGRYFVPLLAAGALALPGLGVLRGWAARAWLAPALVASGAQFLVVPLLVVRRWYLR